MIKIYCMEKIKKEKESPSSKNKTLTLKDLRTTTLDPVFTFSTCILSAVVSPQERLKGVRNERKQRRRASQKEDSCSTVEVQSIQAPAKERGYQKGRGEQACPRGWRELC